MREVASESDRLIRTLTGKPTFLFFFVGGECSIVAINAKELVIAISADLPDRISGAPSAGKFRLHSLKLSFRLTIPTSPFRDFARVSTSRS